MDATADLAVKLRDRLINARPELETWNRYYEGQQPLSYMSPELLRELEGRVRQVVVNWPRLVADSLEERLDVEGFRLDDRIDPQLWDWWQSNGMDEQSQQAHVDMLVMGRAYVIVGADDSDIPVFTVESPLQVITQHDPRTREVTAAVKAWRDDSGDEFATLYLPNETVHYWNDGRTWQDINADVHNMGVVPVVPLINRPRTLNKLGTSELADIVPLSDAACKIATDMMVSADFHAIPRLVALGLGDDDFKDATGRQVSKWEKIAGRIWATEIPPGEADVKQLPEADLRNFHETINALARMAAAVAGLPPHYFGWSDANPASADAIRSAEIRLVKRAERRQRSSGGSWERMNLIGFLATGREIPVNAASLETVWRDAATPTMAQTADALSKLATGLQIPVQELWEKIPGVTKTEVERWKEAADSAMLAEARATRTAFGMEPVTDMPHIDATLT